MVSHIKLFFWCAGEDEAFFQELLKRIKTRPWRKHVDILTNLNIPAGSKVEATFTQNLDSAQIVLPLLSADFPWGDPRIEDLMRRHKQKSVLVLPILLRAYPLTGTPFEQQVPPLNALAIKSWKDQDKAYRNVVEKLDPKVPPVILSHLLPETQRLYQGQQYEEASEYCDQIIELNPRLWEARIMKVDILFSKEEYEKALDALGKRGEIDLSEANEPQFLRRKADILLQLKRYKGCR
jgi:tetratricopeptide (TPR) repeat protein